MSIKYDPSKIELLAARMYASARVTTILSFLIGIALVALAWTFPDKLFGGADIKVTLGDVNVTLALALSVVVALIVILAGHGAAQGQRGQAQLLLCQLQIERNTAKSAVEEPAAK